MTGAEVLNRISYNCCRGAPLARTLNQVRSEHREDTGNLENWPACMRPAERGK